MEIPGTSTRNAAKVLRSFGFEFVRNSSHFIMRNQHGKTIALPRSKEINSRTMAKIVREAGINISLFKENLC